MKLFINKDLIKIEKNKIRHIYSSTDDEFYFSVADALGVVTNSSDPRNYWKVLKNRLKKERFELVTKCNQLKMKSRDNKSYLTDTLKSTDLLELIGTISKAHADKFLAFFEDIEGKNTHHLPTKTLALDTLQNHENDAELQIDLFQTQTHIFIVCIVASLTLKDLEIKANHSYINISGKRLNQILNDDDIDPDEINYHQKELYWGSFAKHIELPTKIKYRTFSANEYKGVITLKFEKEN